ncbi:MULTISPECIES: FAD-dependent oxidoreductase [unclassified Acinetobacter]|uniref:FAD-dependent oxidoreductase n=1 Tax=unclassified Acinetobacter TaxID=196816 RepID=UPI0015D3A77E|nr:MULTISPECIES: FAD-dependent oxidoreductase [unclassified Acinetobacter]
MKGISKIAIIGGGIGGMCAAIQLKKQNYEIDLIEINSTLTPIGAGITLSAATLRAFKEIGIIDEVCKEGGVLNIVDLYTSEGELVGQSTLLPAIGAEDLPAGMGIMRTKLAEILKEKLETLGVNIILNDTAVEISQNDSKVNLTFQSGKHESYDLLVGADGIRSRVRSIAFPEFKGSTFTHQGSWRVVVPRLLDNCSIFLGKELKAGLNPISSTHSYLYFLDHIEKDEFIEQDLWPNLLSNLLSEFKGVIANIKDQIADGRITKDDIVYRPLSVHLMEDSWHKGRIVLIGDAIHATTPHLASGAGIAVEGAIILAEELSKDQSLENALTNYQNRHFERAKLVVETSTKLGELEIHNESKLEHRNLMHSTLDQLRQPLKA